MSIKNQLISGRVPVTTAANVAETRYQYLDLSSAEPNLGTGNTGDVLTYNSSYPGGRKWIPQADIAGSIGQSAYVEANTASANTLYLSGVDLTQNNRITVLEGINPTQNTNITHADVKAQAAFDKANTVVSGSTFGDYFPTGDWGLLTDSTTTAFGESTLALYDCRVDPITPSGYFLIKDLGYI